MHWLIRLYHRPQRRMLRKFWEADPPDLVVSVIPNFNRALFQALQLVNPRIPMVTILTDLADYPPDFWIERQEQYFICGTEKAVQQALELGHSRQRVFSTSGMILRPIFYQKIELDRAAEREKLGLRPDLPTAVVLFGGQGSSVMMKIAERLNAAELPVQLIMICGKNEKLASRLRRMPHRIPVHVVGFTQEVPYYMHISDFMIGKPGPGSISEAMAMKLPVILERNAWTLPQERFNTEWVREKEVGIVLDNFSKIATAVEEMVKPETLQRLRCNVAAIENRAIFEIPEILEQIMLEQTMEKAQ
jgi:1,2-diacylglycerol 3-beta-galactosyltransferase